MTPSWRDPPSIGMRAIPGLTCVTLFLALIALRRRFWSPAGRLHYLLVGLIGLAFLASLRYWNLLDLQF
jgi:hypothetical protein